MSSKIHISELSNQDVAEALVSLVGEMLNRHRREELSLDCELADGTHMLITIARGDAAAALGSEIERTALSAGVVRGQVAH